MTAALYQFTYTPGDDDEDIDMVAALLDAYDTPSALARVLGVSRTAVYGWRHGATPNADTQVRIEQLYAHLTGWDIDA